MGNRRLGSSSLALYCLQRILQSLPSVLGVITIGFLLLNLAPGDPVTYMLGEWADKEMIDLYRSRLGLDAPLYVRYFTYVLGVLQGQLGTSLVYGRPVLQMIWERLPATLILFGAQFIVSTVLGISFGAFAAYKKNSIIDKIIIALSVSWYSIPVFWSGQILLLIFAVNLGVLPTFGMKSVVTPESPILDVLWHLILPATALALLTMALTARLTRTSMVEALNEDYILTARSKGLSTFSVVVRHALRNAMLPVVTLLGLSLGNTLSGSVLVETVFTWPGVGRLMYDAISGRDYPLVLGLFIMISSVVIIANLITDLLYAWLDPRIRY
jgi:ABC-type dipeptide/oligopeptide/nickel transport system permease component